MSPWLQRAHARLMLVEGSTRSAGLLRIALALLAWSEHGARARLFEQESAAGLLAACVFWGSSLAMLIGWKSRRAAAIQGLVQLVYYYYFGMALGARANVHHHTYTLLIGTLLLAAAPCGRSFSLDRYLDLATAPRAGREPLAERGPLWALSLIAIQVSCIYFWGAFDKSTQAWFNGARMTHYAMKYYLGFALPEGAWFRWAMAAAGSGTVILEYLLAFGLWVRPWQRWLIPLGLALHAGMYVMLPVSTFSLTMWSLYLAFLDPEAVHRFIDRMLGGQRTGSG